MIEIILNDINYSKTAKNKDIIRNILEKNKNIIKTWDKVPTLIDKIEHMTGFVSISNSNDLIKISYKNNKISKNIEKEFHTVVRKWAEKYKIDLDYDYKKDQYYLS